MVEIEFTGFAPGADGWTAVIPGLGLLAGDFPEPHLHWPDTDGYDVTTGSGPDLRRAAVDAARAMVDHRGATRGLSPVDAYVLSSVAVDLRISQIVCTPDRTVSAYLRRSIMV